VADKYVHIKCQLNEDLNKSEFALFAVDGIACGMQW
jgi:hypothetical protein